MGTKIIKASIYSKIGNKAKVRYGNIVLEIETETETETEKGKSYLFEV